MNTKLGILLFPSSVFAEQKQGLSACLVSEHPFKLLLHRFLEYEKASAISCSKQYCVFITILSSKLKSLMCKLQRLETIGLLSIYILPINSSHKLALQKVATTNAMFPLHITHLSSFNSAFNVMSSYSTCIHSGSCSASAHSSCAAATAAAAASPPTRLYLRADFRSFSGSFSVTENSKILKWQPPPSFRLANKIYP